MTDRQTDGKRAKKTLVSQVSPDRKGTKCKMRCIHYCFITFKHTPISNFYINVFFILIQLMRFTGMEDENHDVQPQSTDYSSYEVEFGKLFFFYQDVYLKERRERKCVVKI